ncbi:hypothetical protein AB0B78_09780 [Streptomyces sp. NPDC040724]|uniref:hypothetical protein n=1 Tax=Streptomyces sp. NPDC040724 TaxID=3155612 RepID=UPI0033E77515
MRAVAASGRGTTPGGVARADARGGTRDGAGTWVHPWQFGLAVCALLAPVPPALMFGTYMEGIAYVVLFAVTAALVAWPLFLRHRRAEFVRASAIGGLVLMMWSYVGALGGLGVFFLSVPLMWLAAFADPRRRPVAAAVMTGAGALLMAAMATVPGFWWRV